MNVRDADPEDNAAIIAIHEGMGMNYLCPDLNNPLFFVKKVAEDENGEVIGACMLRLTAETYLLLSPNLDARSKMMVMNALQPAVLNAAWEQGLDDIEARIPEETEKKFHKRLCRLGWSRNRDAWHAWTRQTGEKP
jgi:hypothetical protein